MYTFLRENGLSKSRGCQLALAVVAIVAMGQSDAMAWNYGSYGSSGSYGSYGSSGSSGSSASYGSTGSYGSSASYASSGSSGSHGGMFARIRARHAARHAARASHGSYGSSGSSASYGSYGSSGSNGSTGTYSVPATPESAPAEPVPEEAPEEAPLDNSAEIELHLPAGATVSINGIVTTSEGISRNYISNGLQVGRTYSYELVVQLPRRDEPVVKTVKLSAGQKKVLNAGENGITFALAMKKPVKTAVNVTVPENARVFLSGAETNQTGTERSFVTQQLAAGEQWDGYTVRVELEQEGKTLVQERKLSVQAGETYELAFDFYQVETVQVAQLD
jgi:uncharacterized protein (TIGR03000 family)